MLDNSASAAQILQNELLGETFIEPGGIFEINSGATAGLGSTGVIYNYGTLKVDGTLNGSVGSKIVSGIPFSQIADDSKVKTANPLSDSVTRYMEPKAATVNGTGTISEYISIETVNVINSQTLESTSATDALVLVDNGEEGNFKLQGEETGVLEVDENFANRTDAEFTGTAHGLDIVKKVKLSGDNSNLAQGVVNIGTSEEIAEIEIASNGAMPAAPISVHNAKLTINADNVVLSNDLTISGGESGVTYGQYTPDFHYTEASGAPTKAGSLSIPSGKVLTIPRGKTLTLAAASSSGKIVSAPYDTPDTMEYSATDWPVHFKQVDGQSYYTDGIFTYTKDGEIYKRIFDFKLYNEDIYINTSTKVGFSVLLGMNGSYAIIRYDLTNATVYNDPDLSFVNEDSSIYSAKVQYNLYKYDDSNNSRFIEGRSALGTYVKSSDLDVDMEDGLGNLKTWYTTVYDEIFNDANPNHGNWKKVRSIFTSQWEIVEPLDLS